MSSEMLTNSARRSRTSSSLDSITTVQSPGSMAPSNGRVAGIARSKTMRRCWNASKTLASTTNVLSVDRSKVDEALEVTTLSESDVYEVEESEYVRKAEVDEDVKESRLPRG